MNFSSLTRAAPIVVRTWHDEEKQLFISNSISVVVFFSRRCLIETHYRRRFFLRARSRTTCKTMKPSAARVAALKKVREADRARTTAILHSPENRERLLLEHHHAMVDLCLELAEKNADPDTLEVLFRVKFLVGGRSARIYPHFRLNIPQHFFLPPPLPRTSSAFLPSLSISSFPRPSPGPPQHFFLPPPLPRTSSAAPWAQWSSRAVAQWSQTSPAACAPSPIRPVTTAPLYANAKCCVAEM